MKLVFYGGGLYDFNKDLNQRSAVLTARKNPLITYIPAQSYGAEEDFMEFVRGFRPLRLNRFLFFPIDRTFDRVLLREVMKSDIIHLSGGNTFYFIRYLRENGLISLLKDFVSQGRVLTGLSAGGIMMGPTIKSASYPNFDRDDNDEGPMSWRGLNLTKFEFFPHYRNSRRYEQELLRQSKRGPHPILAAPDYSGIVLNGENTEFLGRIYCFCRGKRIVLC